MTKFRKRLSHNTCIHLDELSGNKIRNESKLIFPRLFHFLNLHDTYASGLAGSAISGE